MCRNHSHVRVEVAQGVELVDGSVAVIAQLDNEVVSLESPRTGAKFSPPPAGILLLLAPGPDTPSYSLDQWMAGFSALLFVMGTSETEDGGDMVLMLEMP